ncbi:MAG: hypothetical protein RIS80_680, partial [Actinomycetota bacterium]
MTIKVALSSLTEAAVAGVIDELVADKVASRI